MIYLIAAATAGMLVYMLWLLLFRLRRDRVVTDRKLTRGKFAFRPRDRLRFLLKRSFDVPEDKPQWEDPILMRLSDVPVPAPPDDPTQRE
jgi:hypothetical protein